MSAEPLEGFWTSPKTMPGTLYHFFVEGDAQSVCGRWRLREMGEGRADRKPGHEDCNKCAEIHAELFAVKPAVATEEPAWTVKTDDHDKTHVLYFRGKEQSRVHGPVGLRTQNEMAELFNRTGKKPESRKKVKCAADAPNPEKYIAKNGDKSPELPLDVPATRKFVESDFPELVSYLESLVDDSEIGSVAKPAFLDDVERLVGEIREESYAFLSWLREWTDAEFLEVDRWLAVNPPLSKPTPQPQCLSDFTGQWGVRMEREQRFHLLRWVNFAIRFDSRRRALAAPEQSTNQTSTETKAMPAKTEKAKPFTAPVVNDGLPPAGEIPANQLRRAADNRTITKDQSEKMSDSIREVGVLQPITVRPVEDKETGDVFFEIVLGECRWQGCLAIDENYLVPCFVRNLTDKEAARIRAIENFQRKALDEIEEARAIQNLKSTGWSVDEIINFLGVKKDHIYMRLKLLELGEDAQDALREGSISLHTAVKLVSIPEDKRADALKAVVTPTHSAKALGERDALSLIDRDFIEPARKSKEWEARKKVIMEENPGAKWLEYEQAGKLGGWNSGYVRTVFKPGHDMLSDAARAEELVVPTWGELAKKHGAEVVVGRSAHGDDVYLYVAFNPLITAEKAAFADKPEDCIFPHEAAIQKARDASERRKIEEEAHKQALETERWRLTNILLTPAALNKTVMKKLVEMSFFRLFDGCCDLGQYGGLFNVNMNADDAEEQERLAVLKFLRNKALTPFEAMGRLLVASWISSNGAWWTCVEIFESGLAKPAEFPAHHKEYERKLAELAKREKEKLEREEAQKSNQEDAA